MAIHCAYDLTAPINRHGLRRGHCSFCGVLCYDEPQFFENGLAFCSTFCEDSAILASIEKLNPHAAQRD